jgi:hypothetical protein
MKMRTYLGVIVGAIVLAHWLLAAPIVTAAQYGNCSTESQYLSGEWAGGVSTHVDAIRAYIDPFGGSSQNHICTNPGITLDNGSAVLVGVGEGDGGPGLITTGWIVCDWYLVGFCDAGADRISKSWYAVGTECAWPYLDHNYDLGAADYSSHQLSLQHVSSSNLWQAGRDGSTKASLSDSTYSCRDPDSQLVEGLYQTNRWDLGDGYDADIVSMAYSTTTTGWITENEGSACDFNNRSSYPGRQFCIIGTSTADLNVWVTQ